MCLAHSKVVDEFASQAEMPAFAAGLVDTLNKAGTALSLSIGHRLGIFDAMRGGEALTAKKWAVKLALQERYLAEWFGVMTTAMDKENFNWDGFGQVRASPRLDSGFPLDAPRDSAPRAGSASHPPPSNPSPLRRSRS